MHVKNRTLKRGPTTWWLAAAAGVVVSLMTPLSANADQGNDVLEVLASAAVAYVVIDAVGGFDDGRDRRHSRDNYRNGRHADRHDGYKYARDRDRRVWDRHDHRRSDRRGHHRKHCGHARKYRVDHRRGSGHSHHHRRNKHDRYRAYH